MPGHSPRIKAKKGIFGLDGLKPTLTVTAPLEGDSLAAGAGVGAATATDLESGDITAAITWTSDVDGAVGTGGTPTFTAMTTLGAHVLTAEIVDGGHVVQEVINVTVV